MLGCSRRELKGKSVPGARNKVGPLCLISNLCTAEKFDLRVGIKKIKKIIIIKKKKKPGTGQEWFGKDVT